MSVKRYFAEDMRQALRAVREELGPEAVILSNERVAGGIEVLASLDYDEHTMAAVKREKQRAAAPSTEPATTEPATTTPVSTAPASAGSASTGPARPPTESSSLASRSAEEPPVHSPQRSPQTNDEIEETFAQLLNQYKSPKPAPVSSDAEIMRTMRSEIENLRALLQDQLQVAGKDHWRFNNPQEAAVAERFSEVGLSERVARRLAKPSAGVVSIDEAWQRALNHLADEVPVCGQDIVREGGVVAMLGPTGAGKTTTVAKLAIRYALEFGRENIALVTTDCFRVAAYDQLKTLGRIIDVPVRRVDQQNSLRKIVRSFRDKALVLIDMAGFNQGDEQRGSQLAELHDVDVPVKKLLVLPSTSQSKVLEATHRLFAEEILHGCVLSKVDEAQSLGQVMSLVLENNLPVAYITTGQSIPDDIEVAQPQMLVNRLIDAKLDSPLQDSSRISQLLSAVPMPPIPPQPTPTFHPQPSHAKS